MKKNHLVNIMLLFFVYHFLAQSGEVTYQAELLIPNNKETNINKKSNAELLKLLKSQKKINYKLIFNKNESLFKKTNKMEVSEKSSFIVDILAGNGQYYYNKKDDLILYHTIFSGEYFIIRKPKINWEITQNSRKIGEYVCYEATAKNIIETRRGKSVKNIIAWFTPEIPYNFGPKEYGNLPGLIIELKEDNLILKAKEISLLNKKSKEIKKPKKGKHVTQSEYDSIVKKVVINSRRYKQ